MPKPFHLAWFTNFTAGNWDGTFSHGGSPWDGRFFVDMAQALERACFDYVIYEDKLLVPEAHRGSTETTLKYAQQVPKHDPVPLATMVAAATSRIGVVPTMSTLAWPPFMLAQVSATIDHISGGRFGWNIVTSGEDLAAQNFGMDALPPREARYAMADEYMDVVNQLFKFMGTGRGDQGSGAWCLRRSHEGSPNPFQGRVLQGPRTAQYCTIAAGAADLCAGRRFAARSRFCRQTRGTRSSQPPITSPG